MNYNFFLRSIVSQDMTAWWQSGYAEDCKSLYAGSIPTQASNIFIMIETITLSNFRNHIACRVKTHGCHNVIITGPNGAGKTAILEAVSMLGGDRGLRGANMNEISRFNGDGGFSIFANLTDETEISVCFSPNDTNRRAKIDGDNTTLSDLSDILRIVWLTPKEDRLFIDAASERRAFFDRLVTSFDSSHAGRVAKLSKLMTERAIAIKNGCDKKWLDALDLQIAGTAVAISTARIQYAGELNYFLKNCAVTISGLIETMLIDGNTPTEAERKYLGYLYDNRDLIGDKMILDGPNKSDFGVFNKELNLPANITSTGQQKTVLLELIMSHAKLVQAKTKHQPLILLDEAAAHLDYVARKKLFYELGTADAQVWATGLDPEVFSEVPNAVFVACKNGTINNILVARN